MTSLSSITCVPLFVSLLSLMTRPGLDPGEIVERDDSSEPPDEVLHDHGVNIYQYERFGMTILSLPGAFDFLYLPADTESVASVAQRFGYRFVANGSYFHGDRAHAGWLSIDRKVYARALTDHQLTHIVSYNRKNGTIKFIPSAEFSAHATAGSTRFQTGPLIIAQGRLDSMLINNSVNGRGLHRRTLLAATDLKHLYLITVRSPVALDVLGEFLLRASIFSGKRLDVINLDGGSSVALWTRNFPRLDFNQDAALPILLGVR